MSADTKIATFIRRAVQKSKGYTRLSLVQVMSSGGSNVLRHFDLNHEEIAYDDSRVSEIAAECLASAQDDADGHTGLTSYSIKAFKGVSPGERSPIFRLRSQDADESEFLGDTEPATKEGHLAQLMRHNEALMRQNVALTEVMANQSSTIIARQSEQIKHYEERHWETVLRAEELANERDSREIARLTAITTEKRKDEIVKMLKPLAPVLMAKFKGTPESAKPGLMLESLKEIMAQVSPDDMQKIAEILGPKSLALATIYMDAHKDDENVEESSNRGQESGH